MAKNCPELCKDPACKLTYVEHLRGFGSNVNPKKRPKTKTLSSLSDR